MKHYLAVALAALLIPTAAVAQDKDKDKDKGQDKAPHTMPHGHPPVPHGALPPGHPPFPEGVNPHDPKAMLKSLGATDQQVEQVLEIHRKGMLQAVDLKAAAQKAHMQLKFLHENPEATEAEFLAGIDAVHNAQAAIMKAHVRLTFQIKKAVGPEVFAKIRKHLPLMHGGNPHPGMGMGGPGGMGGHPGMGGHGGGHGGTRGHPGMGGHGGGHGGMRGHPGHDRGPRMGRDRGRRPRWDFRGGDWGDMRECGERMRGLDMRDPEELMRRLGELRERLEGMRGQRGPRGRRGDRGHGEGHGDGHGKGHGDRDHDEGKGGREY